MNEGKNPPFGELEPTGFKDWIKTIKDNPDYVIRQSVYTDLNNNCALAQRGEVPTVNSLTNPLETDITDDDIEKLKQSRALVKDLENYGIKTPFVDYTIGCNDEHVPNVFTVTEKVHGQDLGCGATKQFCTFPPELVETVTDSEFEQIEDLIVNIFHYFQDKILTKGKALYDICRPEQYVLGTTKSNPDQKQIYLVDIDPFSMGFSGYKESWPFYSIWGTLKQFCFQIEKQFGINSPKIAAAIREFHLQVVEPNIESEDETQQRIVNSVRDFTYHFKETDNRRLELCLGLIDELDSLEIVKPSAITELVDITKFIVKQELLVSPEIIRQARAFVDNYRDDAQPSFEDSKVFKTALLEGLHKIV
jgi:hypothetical protein